MRSSGSTPGLLPLAVILALSGSLLGGHACNTTSPFPTLLVLGAATPFRDAVAPLDALVRARPEEAARWARQAESRLKSAAALRRFERAWHFADARAESAGESYSRAIIHELGFVPPTALQTAL